MPKHAKPILDSRHLRILSTKKDDLKDSVVFICLDQEKYGKLDKDKLHNVAKTVDSLEKSGIYIPTTINLKIDIYDKSEFKNKDMLVTIGVDGNRLSSNAIDELEKLFRHALSAAKSVDIIFSPTKIERKV